MIARGAPPRPRLRRPAGPPPPTQAHASAPRPRSAPKPTPDPPPGRPPGPSSAPIGAGTSRIHRRPHDRGPFGRRGTGLRHGRREDAEHAALRRSPRLRVGASGGAAWRRGLVARPRGQRGQETAEGPGLSLAVDPNGSAPRCPRAPPPGGGPAGSRSRKPRPSGPSLRLEPGRGGDVRPGRNRHLPSGCELQRTRT